MRWVVRSSAGDLVPSNRPSKMRDAKVIQRGAYLLDAEIEASADASGLFISFSKEKPAARARTAQRAWFPLGDAATLTVEATEFEPRSFLDTYAA